MYGNVPKVLTGGRALNEDRIIKLDERTLFSKLAATYLFRIATMEVKHVNKNNYLDKVGFEHNGMDMVNLDPLSVNAKHPIVDRYSPFACSLLQCLDYDLSNTLAFLSSEN